MKGMKFKMSSSDAEKNNGSDDVMYNISVKTSGAYCHAGTKARVYMNFIGANGSDSTGYFKLNSFFGRNKFKRGEADDFKVKVKAVGLPILIKIKLENAHADDEWLCEYITVSIEDDQLNNVTFPIYDWIVDDLEVTTGKATLPQNVKNDYIRSMRKSQIQTNKRLFEWIPLPTEGTIGWGLPRYMNATKYKELPKIFKRNEIREDNFEDKQFTAGLNLVFTLLGKQIVPLKNLDSFRSLYDCKKMGRQDKEYLKNWDTDESFGRQVLTGINPLVVSRCTSLPSHFNVTNDDVSKFLTEGKSLEEEMSAGKIYIVDLVNLLTGVERNVTKGGDQLYCANAAGLFYVNSEGKFLPIAIQLVPNDRDHLFTPDDSHHDWLLAKMYFRGASGSVHEWVYHYLLTHSIMEPFSVSLFRCFPRSHPVYKLMRPHLQTVSAMNVEARVSLIAPKTIANLNIAANATALSKKFYETMTFDDLIIPKVMKKQGTDDGKLLPNFPYRDDALALWKIMENYVTSVIRHHYKCDEDVKEDFELQDFAQDVAKNGLGWQDNNTRGMPENITTIDQLVEICVTLMFTSSAQHAAVNFGQFETYKFIPNAPLGMRKPPHKKGEANDDVILDSLPGALQAVSAVAITYALSAFSPNEIFIGFYPEKLFTEPAILYIQQEYREQLAEASLKMKERNDGLEHKYTFLLPERVPNSIAI